MSIVATAKLLFTGPIATLIASGNELSDTEGQLSGAVTVQDGQDVLWCEIEFSMAVDAEGEVVNIFTVRSIDDGLTYEEGASGTPANPPGHGPEAVVVIDAGTSSQTHTFLLRCPPGSHTDGVVYFKILTVNEGGQVLETGGGWVLKTRPARYESVV